MLHELFIALSGHSSPLFDRDKEDQYGEYVSPSERGLLTNLARLGSLQAAISVRCKSISSAHRSLVCRAASSHLVSGPLNDFQAKVIEVEADILRESPSYVGAYGIVPLSSIVQAFEGWSRRLEWLEDVVDFILQGGINHLDQDEMESACTGSDLVNFLRNEAHTGHPEIEETALGLLKVAESAWVRQLASWLLYGVLTSHGKDDFFIQDVHQESAKDVGEVSLQADLLPKFIDIQTARSVVFIGRSLRHIQRGARSLMVGKADELEKARSALIKESRRLLQMIEHPIQDFVLRKVISEMRSVLSRTALQKLLPLSEIVRILAVLRDFMLLDRGEFAVALIEAADESLYRRHDRSAAAKQQHRLGGMMMKEGEIKGVLAQAWSSLAALQDVDEDHEDEAMELARRMVTLGIPRHNHQISNKIGGPDQILDFNKSLFADVLLATPVSLSIRITAPQDLFLSSEDVQLYSRVASYLLSIRRASMHLSRLWQLSVLRRCHPAPPQDCLYDSPAVRAENNRRNVTMRATWSITARVNFFFNQLGSYLQGEVIPGCTIAFHRWIKPNAKTMPYSSRTPHTTGDKISDTLSRLKLQSQEGEEANLVFPDISESRRQESVGLDTNPNEDPESLTAAHRSYLKHLVTALFLNDAQFTTSLRNLMTRVDHIVALMGRLATVTTMLQADERTARQPNSTGSHYMKEETDLFQSLDSVRKSMQTGLEDLISRLNDMDEERRTSVGNETEVVDGFDDADSWQHNAATETDFKPWRDANIARLLMRLASEGPAALGGG